MAIEPSPFTLAIVSNRYPIAPRIAQHRRVMSGVTRCRKELLEVFFIEKVAAPGKYREPRCCSYSHARVEQCVAFNIEIPRRRGAG